MSLWEMRMDHIVRIAPCSYQHLTSSEATIAFYAVLAKVYRTQAILMDETAACQDANAGCSKAHRLYALENPVYPLAPRSRAISREMVLRVSAQTTSDACMRLIHANPLCSLSSRSWSRRGIDPRRLLHRDDLVLSHHVH